ncbi:BTAD domain-containing putative transcriptional regulator [Nonomuraea sp. NPDC003560]|uniref:AfsR/SARP family transcriptional regulator n=1 Tax=Nonomuraea sp. NPDC003560 TaxID=3364341 RepID=UPI00367BD4AA
MSDSLSIGLLGPVTGARDGVAFDLGPARQQAVLVMLVSPPGRVVTMDQLVEGLWGEKPPASAGQSVYTYVAGLRRTLEPGRRPGERSRLLISKAGGYQLLVEPHKVDAFAFSELVNAALRARGTGALEEALRLFDEGLGLWRGVALSGVTGPFAETERAVLDELRLVAFEGRSELLLQQGRAGEAIATLRELAARHPLRERLHELLILALSRSGRQAEALRAYEDVRVSLAEELGIDPGQGLREAHRVVLAGDRASVRVAAETVPRQLPRELIGFVGRAQETVRLAALLAPRDDVPPHPLVVISGPPGVGKSALAVRVAHAVRDRFPDGQLYVSLRGSTPNVPRLSAHGLAGRLLRGIGTPREDVPAELDEAAAMWRSRLHGRNLLVVLDDASGLDQIRPFLSTPLGVSVLVTSRESLNVGDDCVQLRLGRLSEAEATTMLSKLAGDGRVGADPAGTSTLVRLCDGLPLALRIAGARLADHPEWTVGTLGRRLADQRRRLHELAAGDLAVRSSLAASYDGLIGGSRPVDRLAAGALPLLGRLHVPDMTADVAAVLLDRTPDEARRALDRLAEANLIERTGDGRHQLHDLVRLFAGDLPVRDPEKPLLRVLGYFAASARQANVVIDPHRVQLGRPVDEATSRAFATPEEALAWLRAEEHVLNAVAVQALSSPDDGIAELGVRLTFALLWHQQRSHEGHDMLTLNTMALRVCERLGDDAGAQIAHGHIANGLRLTGRPEEGIPHLEAELAIARRLGDGFGQMRVLGNLSNAYVARQRYEEALPHAEQQLAVARQIGSEVGVRFACLMLGTARQGMGHHAQARAPLERALAAARQSGDTTHEGHAHVVLSQVMLDLGDPELSLEHMSEGMKLLGGTGYRFMVECLITMSRACRMLGRLDEALSHATEAVANAESGGNALWERRADAELAAVRAAMGAAEREA